VGGFATPKQGDHVFNDVATAILSPFETISSFYLSRGSGRDFIARYLLHTHNLAKELADRQVLRTMRRFSASEGAQDDALRELGKLAGRNPRLASVNPGLLNSIHTRNSNAFGAAVMRYELTLLGELRHALEAAVAGGRSTQPRNSGMAFQQMLDAAYDPAAALVVVTLSMFHETTHLQANFIPTIVALVDSFERPGLWKEPYRNYHGSTDTTTGAMIQEIGVAQLALDSLKSPGSLFTSNLPDEIAAGPRFMPQQTSVEYGEMLHKLHQYLQRMGGL